jgi:hypothetical protein
MGHAILIYVHLLLMLSVVLAQLNAEVIPPVPWHRYVIMRWLC